ncbi:porin [Planosporangium flavigriseum]|uniref:Glycerol uptake facilitator protein n=1 Tax=Planosporangium flavigriseum TaxID=373681 RepID=A0A8J3LNL9_9ACTN|nr:aquaporin [Planosporangium flavigriseum]NJC67740.1 porin [Planosporangium flavigriseum]GIG76017.1 glycerol uptake facilitator protein [Planosporangium flavigriseum]
MSSVGALHGINAVAPARPAVANPAAVAARKYAVELIGTFFLVFTVGTTTFTGSPLAPLAVGAALMVMIYAGAHISGGHYNPAVTAAALIRGRIDWRDAVGYWAAQLAAGLLAALVVLGFIAPGPGGARPLSGHALAAAFVAELLFTFALCYVVLNVATSSDHPVNSFYGLAVGFTLVTAAIAIGRISGAAINPAITLGACAMGLIAWSMLGIYVVAELIGGVAAGFVFRALNPADK